MIVLKNVNKAQQEIVVEHSVYLFIVFVYALPFGWFEIVSVNVHDVPQTE